jgi:hypothetical protein
MEIKNINRRTFVKVTAGSLATIPLLVSAQAESNKLAEDDATAVVLGYKEKSAAVDAEMYPNHDDKQLCSGCSLYVDGGNGWGACAIFPGKQVAARGWCSAYAAKPS